MTANVQKELNLDGGDAKDLTEASVKPEEQSRSNRQTYILRTLRLDQLEPFSGHPRKIIDDTDIDHAMESIRSEGKVVEPIVVTPAPNHQRRYTIISGLLRFHAAKRLGLETVPAHIVDCKDPHLLRLLLDLSHKPLHPVELADGVVAAARGLDGGQAALVGIIGKNKTEISRASRIAALSTSVKTAMRAKPLSFSVAYEISDPVFNDETRIKLLERAEGLSTDLLRARIDRLTNRPPTKAATSAAKALLKAAKAMVTWLKTNGETADPLNLTLGDVIARLEAFIRGKPTSS